MFLLGTYSHHILGFSPSSSSLISHLIFDKAIPLLVKKPRTALPRLIVYNTKIIKNFDPAYLVEYADDIFDDMLEVISNFHLCQYNICVVVYFILIACVIIHNIRYKNITKS